MSPCAPPPTPLRADRRVARLLPALLTIAALAGAPPAGAQDAPAAADATVPPDAPREPWDISSRTSHVRRSADGGRVLMFEGDVAITHGALTTTSDHAEYLEGLRRVLLTGHVVMTQDSTTVRGPVCYYDRDTRIAHFPSGLLIERPTGMAVADAGTWRRDERKFQLRGRVAAADTSGTLDADAVTLDETEDVMWAVGNARLVDDVSGVVVEGPSMRYERGRSLATAIERPAATFEEEDAAVRVESDEMRYDPRTDQGTALGNVVMRRGSMTATGGLVRFDRAANRAVLEDGPKVVDGSTEIQGDSIEMITRGGGRRTVRVTGSAQVVHRFAGERERPVEAGDPVDAEALEEAVGAARDSVEARAQEVQAAPADPGAAPPADAPAGTDGPTPEARFTAAAGADSLVAGADSLAAAPDSAAADSLAALPPWLKTPSEQLPRQNLLFGDRITIEVVDDELETVEVVGHGRSKFFPNEGEGDLTEWNDVVGDTLHVWFTESQVDSVTVLGHGTGEYRLPAGEDEGAAEDVLKAKGKLVEYQAPEIRYDRRNEKMHLSKGAEVRYRDMQLRSGTIDFDARKEVMDAAGEPSPVLVDSGDEIFGARMRYHLPTEKGEIVTGRTRFENAFYQGTDIWKIGDDALAVENATYTTCDLEQPHFHFSSKHMKIYLDDKVVAKPVVLRIRQIPVFALPFYIASLKKERHSGLLLPNLELGVDDNRGRFIRNLGYYWAPNDYFDATTSFDFYPSQDRIVTYLSARYNLRYRFDGRVALKYNRDVPRGKKDTVLEMTHRQALSPTTDLSGDARFFSSASIYQDIDDDQRLDRDIRSNLTLTKRFPGSNRSLRVDLQRQQNLDEDTFSESLPGIFFSSPSRPLKARPGASAAAGGAAGPGLVGGLLSDLYWNTDARGVRTRSRVASGAEEEHAGAQTNLGLRMTRNVATHLRLSPSVDGEATWIDEDRRGDANQVRTTYRTSVATSTTLYGTFLKPLGPVKGFRHLIEPGASWNWAPEFREYFYVEPGDTTGTLRDRFFSFGGIGGSPRKQSFMSFSLRNLVQTKIDRGEGQEELRLDLFTLRNGISYDLLADETGRKPLSNFSSALNILSSLPVNQSWTVTHDPYSWDLLGSSVTTRARVSSRSFGGGGDAVRADAPPGPLDGGATFGAAPDLGDASTVTAARAGRAGQWAFDVSHTAQRGATGSSSSSLVFNSSWSPTQNWGLTFNTQYDLANGENTAQSWSVRRQIHCWEVSFDRRYLGSEWQYYLRVNIIDLPDIKAERGDAFRGRVGTGTGLDDLF